MNHKLEESGLKEHVMIDSAGLTSYHSGERADERALAELERHGVSHDGTARQITSSDLAEFDYVVAMTPSHLNELQTLVSNQSKAKLYLLMDFVPSAVRNDIPDPYYDDNFEYVYDLIDQGTTGLLEEVKTKIGV